jgi:chemotaxis protein histidine kinase CheA/ActR/RegA family two-component response regulator
MSDSGTALKEQLDRLEGVLNENLADPEQLKFLGDSLEETGELAMSAGYPGLLDLCLIFRDCLSGWKYQAGTDESAMDLSVLATWPDAVRNYLLHPDSEKCREALVELVGYPAWGAAFGADEKTMLKGLLDIHIEPAGTAAASTELAVETLTESSIPPDNTTDPDQPDIHINETLPAELRELISIMVTELLNIRAAVQQIQSGIRAARPDREKLAGSWNDIVRTLGFYSEAVTSIEFHGLGAVINHVRDNLAAMDTGNPEHLAEIPDLLLEWINIVLDYLQNPVAAKNAEAIINFMRSGRWRPPLAEEQANAILALFQAMQSAPAADKKPARPTQASEDDVSLDLPEDVDQDLLEAMLQELPAQTELLSSSLQRLQAGGSLDDILVAKRIAHTLKGAGNTVGIRGIATLTHNLEDILLALHRQETLPTPHIMQTLMNAADCLAVMSEYLLGTGDPPVDALSVMQEVLDMANRIDQEGVQALTTINTDTVSVTPAAVARQGSNSAQEKTDTGEREMVPMLRVPSAFVDNLLRLIGETKISTGQINNFIHETLRQMKDMRHCFDQLRLLGAKVQELTDIKDLNQIQKHSRKGSYDTLEMDNYTELHTYSKWLSEATVDAHEISASVTSNLVKLQDMIAVQSRLNNETQDNVIHARMLPVDTHLQRLQRCVRQASKLTGKPVELHLEGGNTLLDSDTLNALLDPLMHILRNAVDHGIESRDERVALGKPETGNITLSFAVDGNNILVHCRDDGRGLDLDAIKHKAIAQGLLRKDQTVSDTDLRQFILLPNFSTKQETTQVSGRGIGMDAVQASISELSGVLTIESEPGRGTTMRIRLPQNSLSLFALLVRMGPRRLVLANRDIVRIVHHENGNLRKSDDKWTFMVDGENFSALPIEKLLNIYFERRSEERFSRTAILYNTESGTTAVMVEKILGSDDFVVKGLGDYVPGIPGVLGATLLGDGTVAPVLDIAELLRHPQFLSDNAARYTRGKIARVKLPVALVVDDSLSARRSLAQFMQDAGFEVRQARDGMEAMDIILAHKPDLLLSDLEMPRMNGLELTGHVRANPDTADIPVIMITSRAAAKHRDEALAAGVNVYLTKPYAEDELLEEVHNLVRTANKASVLS